MPWSASKIFSAHITDALAGTAAFDLNSDSCKAALYDNDITPDQTVTSANSAYNAGQWTAAGNEVTDGTNWDTGGEPITTPTLLFSSNVVTFDGVNTPQSGASCTLAAVFGCLVYDDTLATPVSKQGVSYHYFGGSQSVFA